MAAKRTNVQCEHDREILARVYADASPFDKRRPRVLRERLADKGVVLTDQQFKTDLEKYVRPMFHLDQQDAEEWRDWLLQKNSKAIGQIVDDGRKGQLAGLSKEVRQLVGIADKSVSHVTHRLESDEELLRAFDEFANSQSE